ncbi:MAG TPA: hypothetical protein VMI47_08995, partial [Pseudolabrys sp.]|nr:hypothetical protein [Pseudolabrys sp.]
MANTPQKSKEASQEALAAAIHEAIGIRDTDRRAGNGGNGDAPAPGTADLFREGRDEADWNAEDAGLPRAANDDRANIGQVLQALRRSPSRTPHLIAGLSAAVWTAGGLATVYLFRGELLDLFATPRLGVAAAIGTLTAIAAPVIFFYVLAHMFRRTQDMRLVAETMAEVAMRLVQPESAAREQIVTVGHAIRREVAAMGDGVERALARASELEALVHNEVSALERAYNDNEVRIRELLAELAHQRETLVGQAEQVRGAISSVHLDLANDITSVGDLVAEKVNEVAQRVTRSLTEKGEHITLALGHAGDSMIDALSERGSTLLDRLEITSDKATTAISSASERLSASLNFKTEHVHDEFAELTVRLQQMMSARLDQVAQGFAQKSADLIEMMGSRSQALSDSIADTNNRMVANISARAEEVNNTLRSTGDSLVLDLSLRGGDVVSKMEQTGALITETI